MKKGDKMAHINSDIKLGFYPTDTNAIDLFLSRCKGENFLVCDPSCGEGVALSRFKEHFKGVTTYGVEIEEERAKKSLENGIDKLICNDALFGVRKNKESFSFLFLNPPYGEITIDGKQKRLETEFMLKWSTTVSYGGFLLLIINPSSANKYMAKIIDNNNFSLIANFKFDNTDHKRFGQYFLLLKREKTSATQEEILEKIQCTKSIDFSETDFEIEIPKEKTKKILFTSTSPLKSWQKDIILAKSTITDEFYKRIKLSTTLGASSIQLPNEGQLSLLLGAGICSEEVNGFLIKGNFKREEMITKKDNDNDKTRVQDNYVSNIYAYHTQQNKYFKLV